MGCERMPHRVASGTFGDSGLAHGILELALQGDFMEVMSGNAVGSGMGAERGGGEDVLPWPFAGGIGPFAQQGFRDVDVARADSEILKVFLMGSGEVVGESMLKCFGQWHDAVPAAFAIMDGDGALTEIDVFDPEAEGFHEPQAGAVHEEGCEFPWIFEILDDRAHFLAGHDDRWTAFATSGGDVIESELLDAEDVFHEKRHGVECLLLGGRGDVALKGKIVEVSGDGGWAGDFRRLAEFVETKTDEAAIPVNVSFLGGHGHVFAADDTA